jgi:hypothetical protein
MHPTCNRLRLPKRESQRSGRPDTANPGKESTGKQALSVGIDGRRSGAGTRKISCTGVFIGRVEREAVQLVLTARRERHGRGSRIAVREKHRVVGTRGDYRQTRSQLGQRKVARRRTHSVTPRNGFSRQDQRLLVGVHSHDRFLKALIA